MLMKEWIDAQSDGEDEPLLKMDGFDDCIAGVCRRFGAPAVILYDVASVLAKLEAEGMDELEAREYLEVNQLGAWVGDRTPAFLETPESLP